MFPRNENEAAQILTSTGVIDAEANVIFKAGESVELDSGFEVLAGNELEVLIEECGNEYKY